MRNVVTSITITTAVPVHIELHANKWDVIMECRVHYEDSVALAFRIIVGIPQMVLKKLCCFYYFG
jgi:Iap family predicted aminopeptidase